MVAARLVWDILVITYNVIYGLTRRHIWQMLFLPEIVKVGTKSYSRKECLQAFSKDTAELSNLEILSTNISELLQILISLGG